MGRAGSSDGGGDQEGCGGEAEVEEGGGVEFWVGAVGKGGFEWVIRMTGIGWRELGVAVSIGWRLTVNREGKERRERSEVWLDS